MWLSRISFKLTTNTLSPIICCHLLRNACHHSRSLETHSYSVNTTYIQDSEARDHLEKAVAKGCISGVPRLIERPKRVSSE